MEKLIELSKNSKYYIPKNRYYELKYFCLQYPYWKCIIKNLDGFSNNTKIIEKKSQIEFSNSTAKYSELRELYLEKCIDIETAAQYANDELSNYILKAVTEGYTYDYLYTYMNIPCCRVVYYKNYRKFFYILDKIRK